MENRYRERDDQWAEDNAPKAEERDAAQNREYDENRMDLGFVFDDIGLDDIIDDAHDAGAPDHQENPLDRKSTRLNSSH